MKRVRYDMVGKAKKTMTVKTIIPGIVMVLMGLLSIGNNGEVYATASTLTLTIDSATIRADVAPTNPQGTFSKTTGSTITASTDNATGYTLSISAPTSAGSDFDKLINTTDNTAKLNSISSPTTEEQYKALNATSYNNTWGYLPSKYCSDGTSNSCATNTSFLPAPTTTGDILDQTTSANSTANTYTIGMGTRIDSSIKTGQYTNSFVVKLVANAIPYTIIYDDNVVSNMPTDISSTAPDSTVSIASNTPTRAGYKFIGWCTVVPTNNNGTDECTGGTTYQPSATLTIDQTGTGNNFHFYAMWKEPSVMQNMTLAQCPTTPEDAIDSRDGQKYKVARLADGNCWLLDNLALDLTNSTVLSGMNENNTHASNTTLNYLKGITTRNPSTDPNGQYATAAVSNWGSSNSYSAPLVNISNKDVIPSDSTSQAGQYKVGGYYNYCAASAGSYCYGNGTSAGTSIGDATEDICPKGWRMPTGNTTGEYQALYNNASYNTYANYRSALRLPLSGLFYDGSASYQGIDSYWWSSTYSSKYYMYYLYAGTGAIDPAGNYNRREGSSVRCVLGS